MANRHERRGPSARTLRRAKLPRPARKIQTSAPLRLRSADRKALLLGTALASTLAFGSLLAPTPASAAPCTLPAGTAPIDENEPTSITCINTVTRIGTGFAIRILTNTNPVSFIDLYNSGSLFANNPADLVFGIYTRADAPGSRIDIENRGDIVATGEAATAIHGSTNALNSAVRIENSASLRAIANTNDTAGIRVTTSGAGSRIDVINSGDIYSGGADDALGIIAYAAGSSANPVTVRNSGDIIATAQDYSVGIVARSDGSSVTVWNSGAIAANAVGRSAYGIDADSGSDATLSIVNRGVITATSIGGIAAGIDALAFGASEVSIVNSSLITATSVEGGALGIRARASGDTPISIVNSGRLAVRSLNNEAAGIVATTEASGSISIVNSGDIAVFAGDISYGIFALTEGTSSPISIINDGAIDPDIGIVARTSGADSGIFVGNAASITGAYLGIGAQTTGGNSAVSIVNSGAVTSTGGPNFFPVQVAPFDVFSIAIGAATTGPGSGIVVANAGKVQGLGSNGIGIGVNTGGAGSGNLIHNSGSVFGGFAGIGTISATDTKIFNAGSVSAGSDLAIVTFGASTEIYNTGRITGFVRLTEEGDTFLNQAGGVFETKLTSDFGGGSDLFRNQGGGTVLAATDPSAREHSAFVNLERFENAGLISLQDGKEGDSFEISNTVGQRNLAFVAKSGSTLGVDAFLGGPGSQADNFIVNGNITGKTEVTVNNTNFGPGVFNSKGIPVVYANGDVKSDAFFLPQPIDTGFFDYDLFFRPTGSGIFELRSFLGAGAFLLPQLTTAAQDLWHAGSSTWFDRTADLRVLLAGGAAPLAYAPTGSKLDEAVQGPGAVPAVWMRGSGSWLDRDDSATTTAYGRTYQYKLDRELETVDFQVGLDLGTRDILGSGDILVFGALGGFVHADLDYEQIARGFDLSGGQVGGYATYLSGGLFVDTLLNVHFLEIDTPVLGFPGSIDATTIGLRTDAGYRFGSFTGGAFIEPLATIAVTWADLDGFSVGGNTVSFDDDANVRGRLGLRVGASYDVTTEVKVEPFVIGSVWSNLSGDTNAATLTSSGTAFQLQDHLDDVWGELSAGVNFFNFGTGTTVFAKVDVTFGDDLSGVGGKAGMRVAW